MGRKFIFFDIDGTLTNDNPGGIVLESTKATIRKLKENGHVVAIATGRAQYLALPIAKELEIANIVHDGGNGITINYELQYVNPLDKDKALAIIDEALSLGYMVEVVKDNTEYRYSKTKPSTTRDFGTLIVDENIDFHTFDRIHRIHIDVSEEEENKITKLNTLGHVRYKGIGIIIEPDDKYLGIERMVDILNGDLDQVVVFGDGTNDLSMFKKASMAIAMENAVDILKEHATFITKSNKDDGIYYACKYFNWIE